MSGRRAKSLRRNGGPHGQCVLLCHDRGAGGKSVFLDTQQALRGDYAAASRSPAWGRTRVIATATIWRACGRAGWCPCLNLLDVLGLKTVPVTSSTSRPRRPAS